VCYLRELGKVAMSVIAKCAFGMTIQDLEAKDNPFMEKAKNVFNPVKHSTPAVLIPCTSKVIFLQKCWGFIDYFHLIV